MLKELEAEYEKLEAQNRLLSSQLKEAPNYEKQLQDERQVLSLFSSLL